MKSGIWEIGEARLCVSCQMAMEEEYVMRCMGEMRKGYCERCGKTQPVTMQHLYTMKGKVKERKGLL